MPTLPLPESPRSAAWDEFVRLVTLDDEMQRIGVAFRSWEGASDDAATPASVEQLPWMRFSPSGGRVEPAGLRKVSVPMTIHVDLLTPGLDVRDSMNLWHVLETIILSDPFRAAMRAAGATRVMPGEAAFGVKEHQRPWEPAIPGAILAIGSIEIDITRDF